MRWDYLSLLLDNGIFKMSIINRNTKWMKIFSPLEKDNISLFPFLVECFWKVNRSRKCSLTSSCKGSGERFCFDDTSQSQDRDEKGRKPGDPAVPAIIYGEHSFYELPVSSLMSEWGSVVFGKGFCEEVYILKIVFVNIIMGQLQRLLIEHSEGDLSFVFLYTSKIDIVTYSQYPHL